MFPVNDNYGDVFLVDVIHQLNCGGYILRYAMHELIPDTGSVCKLVLERRQAQRNSTRTVYPLACISFCRFCFDGYWAELRATQWLIK